MIYTHKRTNARTHTHTQSLTHTRTHAHICMHKHICIHTHTPSHTHACTHTHKHINIYLYNTYENKRVIESKLPFITLESFKLMAAISNLLEIHWCSFLGLHMLHFIRIHLVNANHTARVPLKTHFHGEKYNKKNRKKA